MASNKMVSLYNMIDGACIFAFYSMSIAEVLLLWV